MNDQLLKIEEDIKTLLIERNTFVNSIDKKILDLKEKENEILLNIKEIQKPKFKTDIRYANFVCVLMKDGTKKITKDYLDLNIERELNSNEYYNFVQELGYVKNAFVSHWNNDPIRIMKIVEGYGGYVQPSNWFYSNSKYFPNGHPTPFYNNKLVVDNPTEFWHYKNK